MLDHHQAGIRHIDADLNHRRRHQHIDVARREGGHHCLLLIGLQAPMHQPDAQFRQVLRQLLVGILRRLQLEGFRFLDQGADPIGLPPLLDMLLDEADHVLAPVVGDQPGLDRRAAGRQFVEHGHVEVGVVAHGQRARDGRGRHH